MKRVVELHIPASALHPSLPERPLSVPGDAPWPEYAAAVEAFERVYGGYNSACDERAVAQTALDEAVAADRADLARAHLEGRKKLPDDAKVQSARAELEAKQREVEALAIACRDAARAIVALRGERREEWLGDARDVSAEKRKAYAKALTAMRAAREAWVDAEAIVRWLEQDADRWNPKIFLGRPFPASEHDFLVEAGLVAPAPRTFGEHVRAAGREPAAAVGGAAA